MKKGISILLALLMALFCLPGAAFAVEPADQPETEATGFANFQKVAEYADDVYGDIPAKAWYRTAVAAAYELDLMVGMNGGVFNPKGMVTAAETCTIAAKIHSIYHTGKLDFESTEPWYECFIAYCLEHKLITARPKDCNQPLDRSEFTAILSRALPASALPAIRTVADGQIPDVKKGGRNSTEIYLLYRAGVISGNDKYGTFLPDSPIQRSEVASILTHMVDPALRSNTPLSPKPAHPDLTAKASKGDSYFSSSAMVGNSLVQGMMLYSDLDTMDFYCYQGVTVHSAGSYVASLCAKTYDRVYIQLGINEIYMDKEEFAAAYGKIIDRIRQSMPKAEIYVMAITPVTQAVSSRGSFTMSRIKTMNASLYDLAKNKSCWYLDSCTLLCDSSGYLPEAYAGWDGSPHLSTAGYLAWEKVIRTYYA